MIFEYRCYDIVPGGAPSIHERFANHTTAMMRDHGFRIQGLWEPIVGEANRLHYLLKWDDLAQREHCVDAFDNDPAWRAVVAQYPPLTTGRRSELWRPTSYSPTTEARWPDGTIG